MILHQLGKQGTEAQSHTAQALHWYVTVVSTEGYDCMTP